jgi:predicted transcriptional regulator
MSAEKPARRVRTAREVARRIGASERTIRRIMAEPRADYEARTRARQDLALKLREQGHTWADVGHQLGTTPDAARVAAGRARTRAIHEAETMPPPLFT